MYIEEEKEDTLRTPVDMVASFKGYAISLSFENGEHTLITGRENCEKMMERIEKLNNK